MTGQIGQQRIRGLASARLFTAITDQGALGLEAHVSGQLVFRLAGRADSATLLLRDPDRVVTARPEEILEALIGVKLGPERLLPIFGGCVATDSAVVRAVAHGETLEIVTADTRVFLEQRGGEWRTRAGFFDNLVVEYEAYVDGVPREFHMRSTRPEGPVVRLELVVRDVAMNTEVPDTALRINPPAAAATLSIEELRASGPLVDPQPSAR